MNETTIERRLRRFLLIVVALLCLGTAAELILEKHYKEPMQLVPFVLCALGFVTVLAVLFRPRRTTIA